MTWEIYGKKKFELLKVDMDSFIFEISFYYLGLNAYLH